MCARRDFFSTEDASAGPLARALCNISKSQSSPSEGLGSRCMKISAFYLCFEFRWCHEKPAQNPATNLSPVIRIAWDVRCAPATPMIRLKFDASPSLAPSTPARKASVAVFCSRPRSCFSSCSSLFAAASNSLKDFSVIAWYARSRVKLAVQSGPDVDQIYLVGVRQVGARAGGIISSSV